MTVRSPNGFYQKRREGRQWKACAGDDEWENMP
jgi:hypothetical protein